MPLPGATLLPSATLLPGDVPGSVGGFCPTVEMIALLMPDRATTADGSGVFTFDDSTEPTADQVNGLISMVLDSVNPLVPADASTEIELAARYVVALNVAILIETGYFGEQRDVNDARVSVWQSLLATHNATLALAANQDEPGQARFGSVRVVSPTMGAYAGVYGYTEFLP